MADKGSKTVVVISIAVALLVLGVGVAVTVSRLSNADGDPLPPDKRPKTWAAPIKKPGLPNLHKVSDQLYRGAQPDAEGMKQLKKMGVRTVVNLRKFHSDRDEIGETGLAYEHIYFDPLHPEDKEVVRFLQIVTDKHRVPAFVHCQHGADRTGIMCALYRIAVEGWTREQAIDEMTRGGYGHHEKAFGNLRRYIRKLDLAAICTRAGIENAEGSCKAPTTTAAPATQRAQ